MNGGGNMSEVDYIPGDIIADILSKLPAKSVLRFKTACKTWYSLISHPMFINLHCERAPQNPKILFSTTGSEVQILDYESSSLDDSCLSRPFNFPGESSLNYAKIVGSSRGLVCVTTDFYGDNFSIWNPLTGECRNIVADLSCQVIDSYKYAYYLHGLGYDSVADDFKLVISIDRSTCNVFSLNANSWKRIRCIPPDAFEHRYDMHVFERRYDMHPSRPLAIILSGIFHWLLVPCTSRRSEAYVLAFDVAKESFEKLQIPVHDPRKSTVENLFEHKGCLCVSFSKGRSFTNKEIWMMKEYGFWVHLLTIKNSPPLNCLGSSVLCISTRDELVYQTDRKFSRRGREEYKLDEIRMYRHVYEAVLYVETLVSPNAEDEDGLRLPIKQ
ncbi:F-box protein CPR1-like [Euphorbia lathyris]|uniref:F-box protein CPR1-like n=1 Tax=Euphorbia lathyris TaxID=212925 RepID=UPI0033131032